MARSKMIAIKNAKLLKAFKESAEGQSMVRVAAAMFRFPLTTGLRAVLSRRRSQWEPLSARYVAWKKRHGFGEGAWEMTGGTLAAISNNAPDQIGSKGKLRFGVNFGKLFAFVRPQAFKKQAGGSWKELSASKFQMKVHALLKWGSGAFRVGQWLEKKGRAKGFRAGDFGTAERIPPRNLFQWDDGWRPQMEADVSAALSGELTKNGAPTKAK